VDPVAAVVLSYRAKQARVAQRTKELLAAQWAQVSTVNPTASWADRIPQAVSITRAGMRASAAGSTQYVSLTMRAQGVTPDPVGSVNASAFAETATDGRALGSLLYVPAITADKAMGNGMSVTSALAQAQDQLLMIVMTEVADAGRGGVAVGMMADRRVTGYLRQPGPSACSRCAVLAGVWAETADAAGFLRHPSCMCTAIPASEHYKTNTTAPSARSYFDSLSPQRQDVTFGKGPAEMIRAGADPADVINARRGMSSPGFNWTTTEGTTKRGLYGGYGRNADGSLTKLTSAERKALPPRLTPAAINRLATSREEAVSMLTKYGYIK